MPSKHRPDLQTLIGGSETVQQRQGATKFRNSYLWPDINQEDLVQNRQLLLLFLTSRGRQAFAHADLDAFHIGRVSGAIRPVFLNESTLLLSGQRTSETYGRLVAWEDHDEAFDWMNSGFQFQPGDGLLVLERQQEILRFLVKCCYLLTQDMSVSSLVDISLPVQPEPEPILPRHIYERSYQSIAAVAAEAPHRVPAHLDLERLHSLISARRSAAEDHVWALREDPGYFAEVAQDVSEHRQETLLDINGKSHPVLKASLFWDRVLSNVVITAYGNLIVWNELYERSRKLDSIHRKYAAVIKPDQDLPKELEEAFHTFRYFIEQACKGPIDQLKVAVPPSPPMRSLWIRQPQVPHSTIISVTTKSTAKNDALLILFNLLWDKDQVFLYRLPHVVDLMQRLVQEDPSRLTSSVAEIFSDLALLAETLHQIELYQPWASKFEHDAVDTSESIKAEFAESLSVFAELIKDFKDVPSLARLGFPSRDKFYYPIEKRRTEQTTQAMRKAEENLDIFWQSVDKHLINKSKTSPHDRVRHLLAQNRQVQRTPLYVEPVEEQKDIKAKLASVHVPLPQSELDSERQT